MSTPIQVNLAVVAANYMWFRDLSNEMLDAHGNLIDREHPHANYSLNYDFESMPDNVWLLHMDVGLHVESIAEIKVRVSFQTEFEGSMEPILNMEAMNEVVSISESHCLRGFNERCEANGIAYRHEKTGLNIPEALKHIRGIYAAERKPLEGTWYAKQFATFTPGRKTRILCSVPFMIMDKVFFYDQEFDHRYNAAILFKHVPEPFYYTTKLRCRVINTGDVALSGAHSIYYIICLDCALQLLVGEHEGRFGSLVSNGLTEETRKNFLSWGTEYFDFFRNKLEESGSRFTNFERRPDWNAVLR